MWQERNELAEDVERVRAAAKRVAAEKLELLEKLERAVHLMEHMRAQAQAEKAAMWGGLLRALQLNQPPPSLQEAAPAVTKCAPHSFTSFSFDFSHTERECPCTSQEGRWLQHVGGHVDSLAERVATCIDTLPHPAQLIRILCAQAAEGAWVAGER